jgi:hypothetical protein
MRERSNWLWIGSERQAASQEGLSSMEFIFKHPDVCPHKSLEFDRVFLYIIFVPYNFTNIMSII